MGTLAMTALALVGLLDPSVELTVGDDEQGRRNVVVVKS